MKSLSHYVEVASVEVQHSFISIIRTLGLIVAALPPAIMFSFAAYGALLPVIGGNGATWAAISLGISLEASGVVISHATLHFFGKWVNGDKRAAAYLKIAAPMTAAYIIMGVAAIWQFDKSEVIRITGTLAYAVALVMYAASALTIIAHGQEEGAIAKLKKVIADLASERDTLRGRLGAATRSYNTAVSKRDEAVARLDTLVAERDAALAARDKAMSERDAALSRNVIDVTRLSPQLARYVTLVSSGVTPNGELTDEFGIGASTMKRVNGVFLEKDKAN